VCDAICSTLSINTSYAAADAKLVNKAFLFLKPHANTAATQAFMRDWLYSKGLVMAEERILSGTQILSSFDKQYSLVGRRALILKPYELELTAGNKTHFHEKFGVSWSEAVESGQVRNAAGAAEVLGISPQQLSAAWLRSIADGDVVKFGRGFYCGLIQHIEPDRPALFCINGFYPAMRSKYAQPKARIYTCSVLFDESTLSWQEFIDNCVGAVDPKLAHPESLRGVMYREWKELGLPNIPNSEENCIHASASAFEAFAERCNWLNTPWMSDPVGSRLFPLGMTPYIVQDWLNNSMVRGKRIFDHMQGLGCQECLDVAKQIFSIADRKYLSLSLSDILSEA
jgi:hypothetical protein